jgi:molybdenum cofactor cytidylyltransferase
MIVAGIILAAGAGTRFDSTTHKLLAQIDDIPVVQHAIKNALEANIGQLVVVTGAVDLSSVLKTFPDVIEVKNDNWVAGQAVSIQCGLQALGLDVERVVIGLGDQPGIEPATWRAIATDTHDITVATYEGQRGNPVGLNRTMWAHLPIDGDEGARKLMKIHPELVQEVPSKGSFEDIDTVEDLRRWN